MVINEKFIEVPGWDERTPPNNNNNNNSNIYTHMFVDLYIYICVFKYKVNQYMLYGWVYNIITIYICIHCKK